MSLSKSELKSILKELIKSELEEMTGTGAVAGYNTPNWGTKNKKGNVKAATQLGMELAEEEDVDDLNEGRSRYKNFLESDEMSNRGKISYSIKEVAKTLKELDYLIGLNLRLKSDTNIPKDNYWKRTANDILTINQTMKQISKNIVRLNQ